MTRSGWRGVKRVGIARHGHDVFVAGDSPKPWALRPGRWIHWVTARPGIRGFFVEAHWPFVAQFAKQSPHHERRLLRRQQRSSPLQSEQ